MRNIEKKLSFWLAGYYDDFTKSRAIMDDNNTAVASDTQDHTVSHHGNPMNSEAFLNPRYRYAYVERAAASSGQNNASTDIFSTRYLHNQGIGDFLTTDEMRLDNTFWAGKAQSNYPCSLVANRQKYGGAGSDSYMIFSNGNSTQDRYLVPVGDTDSTIGRGGTGYTYSTGVPATAASAAFLNSAHLTGVWSMISQSVGGSITGFSGVTGAISSSKPNTLYRQIKSPSGMPFLHIKSYFLHNTASKNIIHYDGALRFTGKGDEYFHMRMAAFHHNAGEYGNYGYLHNSSGHWQGTGTGKGSGGKSPVYTLKVGFVASTTPTQSGYTGSAAIEWRWSPHMRYHPTSGANTAHHKSYGVGADGGTAWKIDPIEKDFKNTGASELSEATTATMANDDFWHDFDFRVDWANQEYRVYVDGVEVTTNTMNTGNTTAPYSFADDTITAATARGWEMELVPATEVSGQTVAGAYDETTHYHTLIDRAAVCIDLSNPLHLVDKQAVAIESWKLNLTANGASTGTMIMSDDDNVLGIEDFFLEDESWNWDLLCFAGGANRPVWSGRLLDVVLNQPIFGEKTYTLKCTDKLFQLDRTIPMWDIGQQGLTSGDADDYRVDEQTRLESKLFLGASELLISEPEVFGGTSDNYKVLTNQRMRLNSAHPIQMYNLEDNYGPNKVYRDWEDYPFAGATRVAGTDDILLWFPVASAESHPIFALANGTNIPIKNTGVEILDSGTHATITSRHGSYTHPNGDEIYDFIGIDTDKSSSALDAVFDEINIVEMNSHWMGANSSYKRPVANDAMLSIFLEGYVNTNLGKNIRRGTYVSLTDTSNSIWDSDGNGSRDTAFNYTGVWKVLNVYEDWGFSRTRVILDCPFKEYTGGVNGTQYLADPANQTYTAGTTLTTSTLTMCLIQGNALHPSTSTSQHSRAHALWMQDLTKSAWFKKTFGVIGNTALFGYGSTATTPIYRTNGFMDAALTVSASPPTNHTLDLGTTQSNRRVASGALKWLYDTYGDLVLEFYDSSDTLLGNAIATDVDWASGQEHQTTTNGWLGGAGSDMDRKYSTSPDVYYGDVDLVKVAWGFHPAVLGAFRDMTTYPEYADYWDGRVVMRLNDDTIGTLQSGYSVELSGFDTELSCTGIDGGWILERCVDSVVTGINKQGAPYRMGTGSWMEGLSGAATWFGTSSWKGTNRYGLSNPNHHKVWRAAFSMGALADYYFLKRPGQEAPLTWADLGFDSTATDVTASNFCPPYPTTATDLTDSTPTRAATAVKHGKVTVTIPSKHGPTKTIPAGSYLKVRNVGTDFKHCWVLWADMRNDGTADSDGAKRKSDFGLLYPTATNYKLDLSFTDQIVNGERDAWLNFNPGSDVDIWNIDSMKEPVSGNPWSTLGSNSEANSLYHNWETKAGSFIIIDFSKYFNLNTESTGGRIGYSSGGKKDMGDYITTSAGKSALVDNYWKQAATSFIMPGSKSNYTLNENYEYWTQDTALVTQSIIVGDETVYIDDASEFPHSGFGPLRAYSGVEVIEEHYICWFGKGTGDGPDGEDSLHKCTTIARDDLIQLATDWNQSLTNANFQTQWQHLTYRQFREFWLGLMSLWTSANSTLAGSQLGVGMSLNITADDFMGDTTFDSVQIGSSLSEQYPLRLMLCLKGFVKSMNSGTYWLHDQMRFLSCMALTDNWMSTYAINSTWDIGNVPVTERFMTSTGHSTSGLRRLSNNGDSFGSVADSRQKSILNILKEIQKGTKIGTDNSKLINFNYLVGRDGMVEMRPSFNSGIVLNTTNTKASGHKYNNSSKFTHVRVYYGGGGSFVDYPDPGLGVEPLRWKVIDQGGVTSGEEAREIAKSQYEALKTATHEVSVTVIKDATHEDTMLERGKYGYIADCTQQTFGGGENWFSEHRGQNALSSNLFPGMVNGMDGNLDAYNINIASANIDAGITGIHGNGVSDLYPHGSFSGNRRHTWDDTSFTNDTNRQDSGNSKIPWHQYFYWHGARSVSQAIQVVSVPHNCPSVSATTGEELRITIMLQNTAMNIAQNDTVENCLQNPVFWIVLTDCSKHSTWGYHYIENYSGNTPNTGKDYSHTIVDGNGYVECQLPTKYWVEDGGNTNQNAIVFSVNYDYLCDLLRFRSHTDETSMSTTTGKKMLRNAHGTDWLNGLPNDSNENYNPNSIFPLGCRQYGQFGNLGGLYTMTYAPRLHIVDDLAYTPASIVKYQDANTGYDAETSLSIRRVNWTITNRQTETVILKLEEDETRYAQDFYGWLRPQLPEVVGPNTPGHEKDDSVNDGGERQQVGDGSVDYADRTEEQNTTDSGEEGVYNTNMRGGESYNGNGNQSDDNRMTLNGGMSINPGTIFGQASETKPESEATTIEGLSFGVKTSGRAVMTPDGVVFPGGSSSADFVGEHEMLINLPESTLSSGITIDAIVSLPVNTATERAILYAELESTTGPQRLETSVSVAQHSDAILTGEVPTNASDVKPSIRKGNEGPIERRRVTLFSKALIVGGADAGAAVRLKLFRSSSTGNDTATTTALTIHSVQVRVQKVLSRKLDGMSSFII